MTESIQKILQRAFKLTAASGGFFMAVFGEGVSLLPGRFPAAAT